MNLLYVVVYVVGTIAFMQVCGYFMDIYIVDYSTILEGTILFSEGLRAWGGLGGVINS
jgi:hypothetical protein